jgi:uncharacterized protein (DUF1778 family)
MTSLQHVDSEPLSTKKEKRIDFRVTSEEKELFDQAAALSGGRLTQFAIQALKEAAYKVIREQRIIEVSLKDQRLIVESLLDENIKPNKKLIEAAKKHNQLIKE